MKIFPERSGRKPGEELLPRSEITEAAHDVAKLLAGLSPEGLERIRKRDVSVQWVDYARFAVGFGGRDVPPSLRGHVFIADFESERFAYKDLDQRSTRERLMQLIRPLRGNRLVRHVIRESEPVPDELARELLDYLLSETR